MLTEKQFLIKLAIDKFNNQYGASLVAANCDIKSIPTRYNADRSYEVFTLRLDDHVTIHVHMKFEGMDSVGDYRLELDSARSQLAESNLSLTDEVYVATGTIDPYYLNAGVYKFWPINADPTLLGIFIDEDSEDFAYENGEQMLLETAF